MSNTFNGSETIGQIVTAFPGSSNLFQEHGIDFCCGGGRPLTTALRQKNIEEEAFIEKLNRFYEEAKNRTDPNTDWRKLSSSRLIDHIVSTHHMYLQRELPVLSEFITKILRVHGPERRELAKLHMLFHQMKMELEQHLIAEEATVFPLIREWENHPVPSLAEKTANAIRDLEADHSGVGNLLHEMRAVTSDYKLPAGACRTYTLAFHKLQGLESDLFQHIHLENNILFQRVSHPANES
ncbi:iron-sulfur cluster repair di-iron protein [Paenibacillus sp. MZ04-78.2]|uniref:iron-sulfur cluster repair di-iron protein n=1 Tax=Paenibacillus sp. MZ04-78.2 TaxID=2962034 RepID=UPI0020B87A67|nr:iron-sulfur cluster repair di-iron protein [Paenibacillus sp. MZ04-78.2]MCP3774043.1 iron-sulfur cluster repair di-iron protein [Paenibacillus sp. MZ04-78.2]